VTRRRGALTTALVEAPMLVQAQSWAIPYVFNVWKAAKQLIWTRMIFDYTPSPPLGKQYMDLISGTAGQALMNTMNTYANSLGLGPRAVNKY
jgi:hypothetical protein